MNCEKRVKNIQFFYSFKRSNNFNFIIVIYLCNKFKIPIFLPSKNKKYACQIYATKRILKKAFLKPKLLNFNRLFGNGPFYYRFFTIPIVKRAFFKIIFLEKKKVHFTIGKNTISKKPKVKRTFGKID